MISNIYRARGNRKRFHMVELIFQSRASRRFGKMLGFIDQDRLWSSIFEHLFPGSLQGGSIPNQTGWHMPAHPLVKDRQDGSSLYFVINERLGDRHQRTGVEVGPTELPGRRSHGIQLNNWYIIWVV